VGKWLLSQYRVLCAVRNRLFCQPQGGGAVRTNEELKRLQALPLAEKVSRTKKYIKEWYDHWDGRVYVSFSGGKDNGKKNKMERNGYPYRKEPKPKFRLFT